MTDARESGGAGVTVSTGIETEMVARSPDPAAAPTTLDGYQRGALRTANAGLSESQRLMDAAAGLAEEGGEVLGLVRKHIYMGRDLDRDRLREELGDALWCLATAASAAGLSLSEVGEANLEKLRQRYPPVTRP